MIYLIIGLLSLCTLTRAEVTILPGQNLWRLTAEIGECLNLTNSKLCVIASELDVAISLIDPLITAVDQLASITDSLIDPLTSQLDSIGDILINELSIIDLEVLSAIDLVSALEPLFPSIGDLFLSFLSVIDLHIESVEETILDTLSLVEANLSSKIDALSACTLGITITSVPYVISAPGVYSLCTDVSLTSGSTPAITILSSDVTVDMRNYTVSVSDEVIGVAIGDPTGANPIQSVQLINGVVQGDGSLTVPLVAAAYVTGLQIQNITTIDGANIHQSIGDGCNTVIIDQCNCLGNNGFIIDPESGAIDIAPTITAITNIIINNCYISNPGNHGIRLGSDSSGNIFDVTLSNIEAMNVPVIGFQITGSSALVNVENCVTTGSSTSGGSIGFTIDNSTSTLRWCTAQNYGGLTGVAGFYITNHSTGSLFIECVAQGNSDGFDIYGSNAVLKRCSVVQNTNIGIYVDVGASNTQIFDTCPVTNTIDYVNNGTNTVFINLETVLEILCSKIETAQLTLTDEISQLDADIQSFGEELLSAIDTIIDFTCLTGTVIKQADLAAGPYTISVSGVYTVCEDLLSVGDTIDIEASDVVLNLNGHTVTATGGIGVFVDGQSNILIYNGSCTSLEPAIYINPNSSNVIIKDLSIFDSAQPSIFCVSSSNITVQNCTVFDWNGNDYTVAGMIAFSSCTDVFVTDCQVTGVTNIPIYGFSATEPFGNIIIQSCVAESVTTAGYYIATIATGSLNGCLIQDCVASQIVGGGTTYGYYIFDAVAGGVSGCQLIGNIAETGATIGFGIDQSSGTLLESCISRNTTTGFNLDTIATTAPKNAFLLNCVAYMNTGNGFNINGANNSSRGCKAISNATGFNIAGTATNTVVEDALASSNTGSGINNAGTTTTLVDNRSSNGATSLNPAYSLNGASDVNGTAIVITLS